MLRLVSLLQIILSAISKKLGLLSTPLMARLCGCFVVIAGATFRTFWSILVLKMMEVILTSKLIESLIGAGDLIALGHVDWYS